MNVLDLTKNGQLRKEIDIIFQSICEDKQKQFSNLISEASEPLINNLDWWLSLPVSRNTLISNFYRSYCSVLLVKQLLKSEEKIDEIIVDSEAMSKILKVLIKNKNIKLKCIERYNIFLKYYYYIELIFFTFKQLLKKVFQLIIGRLSKKENNLLSKDSIILIDTFVIPGYYSKDRYYNGLWDSLNDDQKKKVFFLPTIAYTSIKNVISVFSELRKAKRQFLIKEDYLKFSDIFFAVFYCLRVQFLNIKSLVSEDIDFSHIFNNELKEKSAYDLSIEGILNYRFIKRLKQNGINLKLVIDWWENQATDKGLNKGINTFYEKTKIVGYLGYAPRDMELQLFATETELRNNLVPKKMTVIGKGLINKLNFLNKSQEVFCAPAFRYSHIWKNENIIFDSKFYTILIALPISYKDSTYILNIMNSYLEKNQQFLTKVLVKPHPTMSKKILKEKFNKNWPEFFNLVDGEIESYLKRVNVLVSSMSIVCLEALAIGIPVINIKRQSGLPFNPIPKEIPQDLWIFCKDETDVLNAVLYFKNRSNSELELHSKKSIIIKNKYFEPVTKEGVLNFLEFNKNKGN